MTTETPATATPATASADAPSSSAASELHGGTAPAGDGAATSDASQNPSNPVETTAAENQQDGARKETPFHRTPQGRISHYQKQAQQEREARIRAEAERDALARFGLSGARPEAPAAEAAPAPPSPPDPNDKAKYPQGEWDPRYAADLAKHEIREEQRLEREREAEAARVREQNRVFETGRARFENTLNQALQLADGEGGEFFQNAHRVLELGRVPMSRGGLPSFVIDAITESDNAVQVAEVLGRKPEHLPPELRDLAKSPRDLAAMNPGQVQRAIARLDDRIGLMLSASQANAKPSASTPQTPQPATPQPTPAPQAPQRGGAPIGEPPRGDMRAYKSWRQSVFKTR